jgi:hypothetical protein
MAGDRELKAMEATLAAMHPLDAEARQRVLDWLAAKLGIKAPQATGGAGGGGDGGVAAGGGAGDLGKMQPFVKHKNPGDDVARVTTLGYFLTHTGGKPAFKTSDLSKARIDAKLPDFNVSRAVGHAKRAGLLTDAGKPSVHQTTAFGESLVEAMPDAEAMKNVLAQGKKRRRKRTGAKRPIAKRSVAKKK